MPYSEEKPIITPATGSQIRLMTVMKEGHFLIKSLVKMRPSQSKFIHFEMADSLLVKLCLPILERLISKNQGLKEALLLITAWDKKFHL